MEQNIDTSKPYYVYYKRKSWIDKISRIFFGSLLFATMSWLVVRGLETILRPVTGGYSWFGFLWHVAIWLVFFVFVIPLVNFFTTPQTTRESVDERFSNPGLIIDREGLYICDGNERLRIFWSEIDEVISFCSLKLMIKEGCRGEIITRNVHHLGRFFDARYFDSEMYDTYAIADNELRDIFERYRS